MSDLERLELILRRVWAKNNADHLERGKHLNLDNQELLQLIADEIARSLKDKP